MISADIAPSVMGQLAPVRRPCLKIAHCLQPHNCQRGALFRAEVEGGGCLKVGLEMWNLRQTAGMCI